MVLVGSSATCKVQWFRGQQQHWLLAATRASPDPPPLPPPPQFVEKDPRLAESVIRSLLRFWPLTNSHKEVLYLGELEEVLELTQVRWDAVLCGVVCGVRRGATKRGGLHQVPKHRRDSQLHP